MTTAQRTGAGLILPAARHSALPIIAGLSALYLPTVIDLLRDVWLHEQTHGPIVLGIALWLSYRNWPAMRTASATERPSAAGWPVLIIGLLIYVVGRSQNIPLFEVGSSIWLLAAIVLLTRGRAALHAQWFPLFFMVFLIPLPGAVVDLLTMPMKIAVSYAAEHILFWAGFPIARSGVILQIAQYKLLVADACAGLQTLLTLEALGLLYLNLVRCDSIARNAFLAISIVPISFAANVVRVIVLTLITFHFGDQAGRGFLHGFAGMLLFVTALGLIVAVDGAVRLALAAGPKRRAA